MTRVAPARFALISICAVFTALAHLGAPGTASAAAPVPCGGTAQITDAVSDGHHGGTDITSAWFAEANGTLQVVIQTKIGLWVAEHEDAGVNGTGYVMQFTVAGRIAYVRAFGPPSGGGPVVYDYGTYTRAGGWASAGTTTGETVAGSGGTVTIDVPAATGATAGALLAAPFVLTYDGVSGGVPDWVDHAPGGVSPDDTAVGADFRVGSCTGSTTGPGTDPVGVTAVRLNAPKTTVGTKIVQISGVITPARAGVNVVITRTARTRATTTITTSTDGSFGLKARVGENTRVRAVADGIGSQTLTIAVRSTVQLIIKRLPNGGCIISGVISPTLPGAILLLRTTAATPSSARRVSSSRFQFRLRPGARVGGYQVVYVPKAGRAERSVSNAVWVR